MFKLIIIQDLCLIVIVCRFNTWIEEVAVLGNYPNLKQVCL